MLLRVQHILPRTCTTPRLRCRAANKYPSAPFPDEEDLFLALAVKSAQSICFSTLDDAECTVAWDSVDEIIRGLHKRREKKIHDPLEAFCAENPDADECKIFDF